MLLGGLLPAAVQAQQACYVPRPESAPEPKPGDEQTIYISADRSETQGKESIKLDGDIELIQGKRLLRAESVEYQQQSQRIIAEGNISLSEEGLLLKGKKIVLDAHSEAAQLIGGEYQMAGRAGRGGAEEIVIENRQRMALNEASYTTCPPGDDTWRFVAGEIELLPEENTGIARHMRLELSGVPVLYLPYINFPLGERKTGLLAPQIGSSDTSGREVKIPFYWNIAPDRDATFSVRYMSQRGTQLSSEFRYLQRNGFGQLDLEYLDQDKDKEWGSERHFVRYQHQSFWQAWQAKLDLQQVSDREYFRQLSSDKQRVSSSLLESRVLLDYRDDEWFMSFALDHQQNLDEQLVGSSQPTMRLPQLRFASYSSPFDNRWQFTTEGELAYLEQADEFNATRLDIIQKVSAHYGNSAVFIKPMLAWRGTAYWIDQQFDDNDHFRSRQLPMASLDSGMWLERLQPLGDKHYRQTLEPRLFLLYVPHRNQQQLPEDQRLFDALPSEFDFDSLFSESRYHGVDRVGDDQRMTFSFASRWFDDGGRQRLRLRVAQGYHFVPQRVTLAGESPQLKGWSNLLAQIDGRINRFLSTTGLAEWDDNQQQVEKAGIQVTFERDSKRRVMLGTNYRRTLLNQGYFKARWPIDSRWSMMADSTYSFQEDELRNAQLGVEYDDCCWRVRVAAQQYISENDGSLNQGIAMQFELKGLTSVGSKISGFAESEE